MKFRNRRKPKLNDSGKKNTKRDKFISAALRVFFYVLLVGSFDFKVEQFVFDNR